MTRKSAQTKRIDEMRRTARQQAARASYNRRKSRKNQYDNTVYTEKHDPSCGLFSSSECDCV